MTALNSAKCELRDVIESFTVKLLKLHFINIYFREIPIPFHTDFSSDVLQTSRFSALYTSPFNHKQLESNVNVLLNVRWHWICPDTSQNSSTIISIGEGRVKNEKANYRVSSDVCILGYYKSSDSG